MSEPPVGLPWQDPPSKEIWGVFRDATDDYEVAFDSREAAIEALGVESGAVIRCVPGLERDGLEYLFDVEHLIGRVEDRAQQGGRIVADFELGIFDPTEVQLDDLRRRLADALFAWVSMMNPPSWTIVEVEDVEVPTNAQDRSP